MKHRPVVLFGVKLIALTSMIATGLSISAQEYRIDDIHFDKISVGPGIHVVLEEGNDESLEFTFDGVEPSELNVERKGSKVIIYLDGARNLDRRWKMYARGAHWHSGTTDSYVTAFITYRSLEKLTVKGDQDVSVGGRVTNDIFKLKAYGDLDISFDQIYAEKFKAKLYGDTHLSFNGGSVNRQKYVLFGEHIVNAERLAGESTKATNFGDSYIDISARNLKLTAFGETRLKVSPDTDIQHGIVLGETAVTRW